MSQRFITQEGHDRAKVHDLWERASWLSTLRMLPHHLLLMYLCYILQVGRGRAAVRDFRGGL